MQNKKTVFISYGRDKEHPEDDKKFVLFMKLFEKVGGKGFCGAGEV